MGGDATVPAAASRPARRADLVLEGGGVKGVALAGALAVLARSGYTFPRVAGTSGGAVVAALLVALQRAGEPPTRLEDLARSLAYDRFRDRGALGRLLGPLGPAVDVFSLAFESGVFEGEYLRRWLAGTLADLGVRTFGDLRADDDPGTALPEGYRYRLVVTASDVSRQRLVRLPWDYPDYGLDPDEQRVADAVRASAAIPFFFEPSTLRRPGSAGASTLVDGGVLSNFPVALFDRTDGSPPRWPTFGVRLSAREGDRPHTQPVRGPVSLALAVVETMLEACDAVHVDDPCVQARSIFVDTSGVSPVDFDISPARREHLLGQGRTAAERFLATWDFDDWLTRCREAV